MMVRSAGWGVLFLTLLGIGFVVGILLIGTEPWEMTMAMVER